MPTPKVVSYVVGDEASALERFPIYWNDAISRSRQQWHCERGRSRISSIIVMAIPCTATAHQMPTVDYCSFSWCWLNPRELVSRFRISCRSSDSSRPSPCICVDPSLSVCTCVCACKVPGHNNMRAHIHRVYSSLRVFRMCSYNVYLSISRYRRGILFLRASSWYMWTYSTCEMVSCRVRL